MQAVDDKTDAAGHQAGPGPYENQPDDQCGEGLEFPVSIVVGLVVRFAGDSDEHQHDYVGYEV